MIDLKEVKSIGVLGWNFGLHILRSIVPRKKENQAEKFKGYFSKDGIAAFKKEEIDQIYNFQQCTVCGLCQEVCIPSWVSQGKFLGPEHIAACAGRSQPEYISDADDFFRCTLCGRCEPACPEEVKISELAWLMRRWIYRVDPETTWSLFPSVKKNLDRFQNPFGPEKPVKDTGIGKDGRVLFLGCRETALGEPEKWVELVKRFGIEASLVSGVCCGGLLDEIGAENLSPGLEKLLSQNPQEVITTCPHCFYHLKKKLPDRIKVKFIMEVIPENLSAPVKLSGPVVYHDPCFLSRKSGMAELPRNLMKRIGLNAVEFSQSNSLADCCGGGGGLFWYDIGHAAKIAARRVQEAQKLGAEMILTECGICKDMLEKAAGGKIKVKRLSELFTQDPRGAALSRE